MTDVTEVRDDLLAEQEALDRIVAGLDPVDWSRATPSPRWTVAHQIGHLAYYDRSAATAITDPEAFAVARDALLASFVSEEQVDAHTLGDVLGLEPPDLLEHWREGRRTLADAAASLENDTRIEWYGPSMGSKSFLTARLMECWAHGQDVVDAVGGDRPATDRLRHIAQLGVITRGWTYLNRGEEPPEGDVAVRLTAPSGAEWTWGPADAGSTVVGAAEDFCLVVTQRRHMDDTGLVAAGDGARDWLVRAQAFAGPATDGPPPGGAS